jgi:PKD repeat protein
LDNNTLPYLDAPVAYAWDFGDNSTSGLKSPLRAYESTGVYNVTLRVMDQGNTWSDTSIMQINVSDTSPPIPIITVNNVVIENEINILTNQLILFSAARTVDNVPSNQLEFSWDWGDGSSDSAVGGYEYAHEWGDISGTLVSYNLTLTVFDGVNTGIKEIIVNVNNRIPIQIFSDNLSTYTYTALVMPDVFTDDDGSIIAYAWSFPSGVNLDGGVSDRTDDFTQTTSNSANPMPAWDSPGLKTVQLTVTDDDGSSVNTTLSVMVHNQLPVGDFIVRTTATSGSSTIDFRVEDGQVDTPYTFDGRDSFDPDGTVGDSSDLTFNWTFSDGTFGDRPQVTHSFTEPGTHSVTLIVFDEAGESSAPRTMTIEMANPLPIISVRILDAWLNGEIITDSTTFDQNSMPDMWSRTFNEEGQTYAAPNTLLYFDSDGTRDGDRMFEGKYIPLEAESPDWNGLVQYSWDFGDGTPIDNTPSPWHAYTLPGEYTVSLTVRDAFGTGDVSRATFTVIVDHPPVIHNLLIPDELFSGDSNSFGANISDLEVDLGVALYRDTNVNDGSISDRDESLNPDLVVRWDLDVEVDEDANGNPADDWVDPLSGSTTRVSANYEQPGVYTLLVEVCDGLGMCTVTVQDIEVSPPPTAPPSLSDFSVEDWKSWLTEAGSDLATFVALISVALILGWLVMREPSDLEDEAKQAAESYSDVEMVESQGGLLGMDHHTPPPAPGILSKDERRSDDSGYVRPLRRRG